MEMLIVIITCLLNIKNCCRIVAIVIVQVLVCVAEKKMQENLSLTEIAKDLQGSKQTGFVKCYNLEIFLNICLVTKCLQPSYFHLLSCFHFVAMFSFVAMVLFLGKFWFVAMLLMCCLDLIYCHAFVCYNFHVLLYFHWL